MGTPVHAGGEPTVLATHGEPHRTGDYISRDLQGAPDDHHEDLTHSDETSGSSDHGAGPPVAANMTALSKVRANVRGLAMVPRPERHWAER